MTWLRLAAGVALTPCLAAVSSALFARARLGDELGSALAFAGGALLPLLGLSLAACYQAPVPVTLGVALVALLSMSGAGLAASAGWAWLALTAVDTALVALGWALGASLGRRVQHASHLLPACVVAASADLVSVLSPEGPSHAVAHSDRALSVLATWFPIPGAHALSPALGLGDLLFMGLILGLARAQRLPYTRSVALCAAGTALAGVAAAYFQTAIPALPLIAVCVLGGLPAARKLRPADRNAAWASMLIASSVALASILRNFWIRP